MYKFIDENRKKSLRLLGIWLGCSFAASLALVGCSSSGDQGGAMNAKAFSGKGSSGGMPPEAVKGMEEARRKWQAAHPQETKPSSARSTAAQR